MKNIHIFIICIVVIIINTFSFSFCLHHIYTPAQNANLSANYWRSYVKENANKIRNNWEPKTKKKKPVVIIQIGKKGELLSYWILKSSKSSEIDSLAIKTIEKSAPFSPLPLDYPGDSLFFEYVFDYGKLNNGLNITFLNLYVYQDEPFWFKNLDFYSKENPKVCSEALDKPDKNLDLNEMPYWSDYMRNLETKIKKNWNPPKSKDTKRVIVNMHIGKDGGLLAKKLKQESGDLMTDVAAFSAIDNSLPLNPLPEEFTGESITIEFTFDYKVSDKK